MYFKSIPNISYDKKPISYPFSESDRIIAKNFFRRYKLNDDVFGYATFYKKYTMQQGVKIETIAEKYYGDSSLWWYIAKANNKKLNTIEEDTLIVIPSSTNFAQEI